MALHRIGVDHWPIVGCFQPAINHCNVMRLRRIAGYDRSAVGDKVKDAFFVDIIRNCPPMPFGVEPSSHRYFVSRYIAAAACYAYPLVNKPMSVRDYPQHVKDLVGEIKEERCYAAAVTRTIKSAGIVAVMRVWKIVSRTETRGVRHARFSALWYADRGTWYGMQFEFVGLWSTTYGFLCKLAI